MKTWNIMRILRLVAGAIIIGISINNYDLLFIFLGAFLILHALLDLPCCCSGSCSNSKQKEGIYKDIIKPYKK